MIHLHPYNDPEAWEVFRFLDGSDFIEAEIVRGARATNPGLFADWHQMEGVRLLSHVVLAEQGATRRPFAVIGLSHSGQAGVAHAAMLAKDHRQYRRELIELGIAIRHGLPDFCAEHGVRRIEARAWAHHPTASRFLQAIGFQMEAAMAGFGADKPTEFLQFAYVSPTPARKTPCA